MQRSSRILFTLLGVAAFCGAAPPLARAASEQIGLAVVIRNDVTQVEPAVSKILQGDNIVRDEVVQTRSDSNAKFVLKDSTNLILGPNSRLKLDRAVFSDEKSVGDIAIKLSVGSFRFITGHSAKESYSITTPVATMGVRGTTLDLLIERLKNTVVLQDGMSQVCAAGKCVELLRKGDTAVISVNGTQVNIEVQPSSTWSFDASCNGMCSPMSFAQAEDSLITGSIGAGGGGGGGGTGGGGGGGINANLGTPPTDGSGIGSAGNRTPPLTTGLSSAAPTPVSPF